MNKEQAGRRLDWCFEALRFMLENSENQGIDYIKNKAALLDNSDRIIADETVDEEIKKQEAKEKEKIIYDYFNEMGKSVDGGRGMAIEAKELIERLNK